jgi:hypothetical protein
MWMLKRPAGRRSTNRWMVEGCQVPASAESHQCAGTVPRIRLPRTWHLRSGMVIRIIGCLLPGTLVTLGLVVARGSVVVFES